MVEQSDPTRNTAAASPGRVPGWWYKTVNDPVKVSLALVSFAFFVVSFGFAFGAWYIPNHVTNRLDKQSADIDDLKSQLVDFDNRAVQRTTQLGIDIRKDILGNTQQVSEQLAAGFEKLDASMQQQVARVETDFRERLSAAEQDINSDISEARDAAEAAVVRVDQAIPEASKLTEELSKQQTVINKLTLDVGTAERNVASIEMLIKLGINHSMVQDAVLSVIKNNADVLATPKQVEDLWHSKQEQSSAEFEAYLLANYKKLNARDALLMSYDELTENKPVEYFIDLQEIKASGEPDLGAALDALEESLSSGVSGNGDAEKTVSEVARNVELLQVDELTIVRICDELTGIADTECYKYFLSGDHQVDADGLIDVNANEAIVRAIASKYQKLIPDS